MTPLNKPVTRRAERTIIQGRALVVTLIPGDSITIRQAGRRTAYTVGLAAVYVLGAKAYAEKIRAEKKLKRKLHD